MLIPSDRHTAADLRHWAELEACDAEHARSGTLAKRIEQAGQIVAEFLAAGPAYISISWGKDSVATADLVLRLFPSMPIRSVRWPGSDNPDSPRVRDAFFAIWPAVDYAEIMAPPNDRDDGRLGFELLRCVAGNRRMTGIRRDESGMRKLSARVHGRYTDAAGRPLLYWSAQDVYSYLHARGLPVHPVYAMTGGGRWPRDRFRVDSLGGSRGTEFGRAEWEAEYYGDHLRRLAVAKQASVEICAKTQKFPFYTLTNSR